MRLLWLLCFSCFICEAQLFFDSLAREWLDGTLLAAFWQQFWFCDVEFTQRYWQGVQIACCLQSVVFGIGASTLLNAVRWTTTYVATLVSETSPRDMSSSLTNPISCRTVASCHMLLLTKVAAEIRAQCLADLPDASGAAERAYQQACSRRGNLSIISIIHPRVQVKIEKRFAWEKSIGFWKRWLFQSIALQKKSNNHILVALWLMDGRTNWHPTKCFCILLQHSIIQNM